ncbi:MAG: MBL fold metallo-hydrolase [Deltaproteobacteria bacterium]|nr:MBL fold metallo-hydrolase [Deltaproteobacteria bacterium]
MKSTHHGDILTFSTFDEARNLDFNGYFLVRPGGNVMVDPVPLTPHDLEHVRSLGGVQHVLVTNSDHVRDTAQLAEVFGAEVVGPAAERDSFPIRCDVWLDGGTPWIDGLEVVAVHGSKTPGELALVVDRRTLITGDLIRGQTGGGLNLLPDAKLVDPKAARASVQQLASRSEIDAVLVGDGWPVFRDGHARLLEL